MSKPPAIVVIRLSSLGDCLLLGPLFRALKTAFPNHQILWITKPPFYSIWNKSQWVDQVILYTNEKEKWKRKVEEYDVEYLYDLQSSLTSKRITLQIKAKVKRNVKPPRVRRWLTINTRWNFLKNTLPVPLRYLSVAKKEGVIDDGEGLLLNIHNRTIVNFPFNSLSPVVALAYGSKHPTKCWKWENYKELSLRLLNYGLSVLWVVGPEETDKLPEIENLAHQFPNQVYTTSLHWQFDDLISAISRCKAIVTNDSAAMHIAAGTDVRGIAFFGPTITDFGFAPFRSKLIVLERNLPCRPCSPHGSVSCPLEHHRCLEDISVNEVWEKLQEILKQ